MASLSRDTARNGYRLQFYVPGGAKKSVWLGSVTKKQADTIKLHVEYLIVAKRSGLPAPSQTAQWLGDLSDVNSELLDRLAIAGLVAASPKKTVTLLRDYMQQYIDSRLSRKPSTVRKYEQTRDSLLAFFQGDRTIDSITSADAERWREWMLAKGNRRDSNRTVLAENTVRRRSGIAKQFFSAAIKDRLITENPFSDLPASVGANEARQHFIDHATIDAVIAKAPDAEWRAFIALARYGGLRCPSEPMALRWEDVDLINGRLSINSPKTGLRLCPIFPELRPYLEELAMDAQSAKLAASELVFQKRRGSESVWRTHMLRLIKRAGLVPWPKLFQNLRASRETELLEKFPVKDVCSWIGNSQVIAMRHYAMARSSVFAAAVGITEPTGPANQQQESHSSDEIRCSTGCSILEILRSICCSIGDSQELSESITVTLKPKYLLVKNEKTQAFESIDWASRVGGEGAAQPAGIIGISECGKPVVLQVVLSRDVRSSLALRDDLRKLALEAAIDR